VYRITYKNKYYIGKRSSKNKPEFDIGFSYFTSGCLQTKFKNKPNEFKIKIIKNFESANLAVAFEVKYHKRLNVGCHKLFYNKANQTCSGFDTTGHIRSNLGYIKTSALNNDCVAFSKGYVSVKDKDGNTCRVKTTDPRYLNNELISVAVGCVNAIDKNGHKIQLNKEQYGNGEYSTNRNGFVPVKDKDGNTMSVSVDDPRYLSGELVHVYKNLVTAKNKNTGEILAISKCEFDNNENFVGVNHNNISGKNNPNAKTINIFNESGKLINTAHGNLKQYCDINNYPYSALRFSQYNNGEPIHMSNRSLNSKFRGWYAICIS